MTTPQVRNVMFVVSFTEDNPLDDEGMLDFSLFPEYVKYCVYQLEVGAEGTEHFQGYMELSGKHSFKSCILFPVWSARTLRLAEALLLKRLLIARSWTLA